MGATCLALGTGAADTVSIPVYESTCIFRVVGNEEEGVGGGLTSRSMYKGVCFAGRCVDGSEGGGAGVVGGVGMRISVFTIECVCFSGRWREGGRGGMRVGTKLVVARRLVCFAGRYIEVGGGEGWCGTKGLKL